MARILVQTDDGSMTLVEELHVNSVRMDSETEAMNLLERLAWAIAETESRQHGPVPRPPRRLHRPRRPAMRGAAVTSGVGRTFD